MVNIVDNDLQCCAGAGVRSECILCRGDQIVNEEIIHDLLVDEVFKDREIERDRKIENKRERKREKERKRKREI